MDPISIRAMVENDMEKLRQGFTEQGWERDLSLFQTYFEEQAQGSRFVLVAESEGEVAGYVTLVKKALQGPFAKNGYPEIKDFNVFIKFQRNGIGNQLLHECERIASTFSKVVTLGVGLHSGYGPAQRLYVNRGYIPDGSGVWYEDKPLPMNATCQNNDSLIVYLSKKL